MQVTGQVRIKVGSETLRTKPGASLQIGGWQRDFDMTDQNQSYFREKQVVAAIKGTLVHASDTDLVKLRDLKNFTAFFETDSGRVYTIANAAIANLGDLSNGEVEINIMGDPAQE